MNNILIPYDFSEHAETGLKYAVAIGKVTQAKLHILHVIEFPVSNAFSVEGEIGNLDMEEKAYVLALAKKARKDMNALLSSEMLAGLSIESHLIVGKPYQGIADSVEQIGADMIVMGTRGASGLEEILIGSNAERVVRKVKCPVITVHSGVPYESIEEILCAVNISDGNEELLGLVKQIQQLFNSKLNLLWVNTPREEYKNDEIKNRLESIANKNGLSNYSTHTTTGLDPDDGIIDFANELGADLIAVATHSRKGLAHVLLGSVAEDTINQSNIPVLTITLS